MAVNVTAGYEFENGLAPEAGVRYLVTSQDSHNDGAQHISSDNSKVVTAAARAVEKAASGRPVILIGYSGDALLSGLVIEKTPHLSVKKWITLAGLLNHTRWTTDLRLPPLKDSVDLQTLPPVSQLHLIGEKDRIVSAGLTAFIVKEQDLIIIPDATHTKGFEKYYPLIYENE